MNEILNNQIEQNLELIFNSDEKKMDIYRFVDENGVTLKHTDACKRFATILESQKLIDLKGIFFYLTEFGYQVQHDGGWLKYLENSNRNRIEEAKRIAEFEALEMEQMKLDIELQKRVLKDYPRTKWTAIISLVLGIIGAFISIWQLTK